MATNERIFFAFRCCWLLLGCAGVFSSRGFFSSRCVLLSVLDCRSLFNSNNKQKHSSARVYTNFTLLFSRFSFQNRIEIGAPLSLSAGCAHFVDFFFAPANCCGPLLFLLEKCTTCRQQRRRRSSCYSINQSIGFGPR